MNQDWSWTRAFSWNRFPMKILGIWPLESTGIWCQIRFVFFILAQVVALTVILAELSLNCTNATTQIQNIVCVDGIIRGVFSKIFLRIYAKNLSKNLYAAMEDWTSYAPNKDSYKVMKQYAKRGWTVAIIIATFHLVAYLGFAVPLFIQYKLNFHQENITTSSRKYIFSLECLLGDISSNVYLMILVGQAIFAPVPTLSLITTNTFFFNMIMHVCGQLELLNQSFLDFCQKNGVKDDKKRFAQLIKRHCELRQLVCTLNRAFDSVIFFEFFTSSILIAGSGFTIIAGLKRHSLTIVMQSALIMVYALCHASFTAYACDSLTVSAEMIHQTIWNTDWYKHSVSSTRKLLIVLNITSEPIRVSAGKYYYISRVTVLNMVKTAYSYVSFLQVTMHSA